MTRAKVAAGLAEHRHHIAPKLRRATLRELEHEKDE
jgi:hypothetical protein